MIATLNFPTLLHFPLGDAREELNRVVKKMSPLAGANLATPLAATQSVTTNWWQAGGATGCVQALQPKGAASYAASLLDLSGSGNNASASTAPSWDTASGWTFNGSTQFVDTGITPTSGYFIIFQFTGMASQGGAWGTGGGDKLAIWANYTDNKVYYDSGFEVGVAPGLAAGNLAVGGTKGYRNGTAETTGLSGTISGALSLYIGATHGSAFLAGTCVAWAVYSSPPSDAAVLAIATAMTPL